MPPRVRSHATLTIYAAFLIRHFFHFYHSDNALIAIAKSAEDDHDSLHTVAVRIARAVRTKTKSSLKIERDLVLPSNDITVVVCKPSYHAQQITDLHM